jgi:hypothetical protein
VARLTEQERAERQTQREEYERRLALPLASRDKLYRVEEYAVQAAKYFSSGRPRGICSKCLVNYTMKPDNTMVVHRPGGTLCGGSELPSLGLPRGWYSY